MFNFTNKPSLFKHSSYISSNCFVYFDEWCFLFLQALDLVDNDLLADMEAIDLSILGELRLNSIDNICADISSLTGGFVWSIGKGLLGDLGDMDFSAIKNKSRKDSSNKSLG